MPVMESPCTKICTLDPSGAICVGCGRTGDEIARWLALTADERRAVVLAARERLERRRVAQPFA